ncbi:hypothetical protein VTK73DRAFT_10272 [Phialemonium thermophilum]|uniref:F-box domain-containing protein n=1 Tax=Phialemonium thermophilum TaxID=223376 RepID=A0ABR3XH92_9PEZI
MALLELPPELLCMILGCLGSEFFRQDVSRLAVSRKWYYFARNSLLRDLRLSEISLRKFTSDEAILTLCKAHVSVVVISLEGHQNPNPLWTLEAGEISTNVPEPDEWTNELNYSLEKLADMLRHAPGLRHLGLKAGPERPDLGWGREGYLMIKPLSDLLSMRHLTSLDFDIAGSYPRSRACDLGIHLCRSINALLPSLRRLRCRMDAVCEDLLDPPTPDSYLLLKEVIVNLSLSELSDDITSYRYPVCCTTASSTTFLEMRDMLIDRATTLSQRLLNPQTVRVIWHELPSLTRYAWDAIAAQRIQLGPGTKWDAEGWVVDDVEQEDETDLFDSDSPSPPQIGF